MNKIYRIFFLFPLSFFLVSCGGDETESVSEATTDTTAPEVKPEKAPVVEEVEEESSAAESKWGLPAKRRGKEWKACFCKWGRLFHVV